MSALESQLQRRWSSLWERRQVAQEKVAPLWEQLRQAYTEEHRHYHNLQHLAELFDWRDEYRSELEQPDTVALAIWYHDVVYNIVGAKNNESKSADLAIRQLKPLGLTEQESDTIHQWILATKSHQLSSPWNSPDAQYFMDFDLAILGAPREKYALYASQIRQEYGVYPDLLYKPGRRKVLKQLLNTPHLYHTTVFREKLEQQARENLKWELDG